MHRLYGYILATLDCVLVSPVDWKDRDRVCLFGFPDADHSGCKESGRSTSGNYLELATADRSTVANLEWSSKRQSATAHSTTEAELISASKLLRESALPGQMFWEQVLERNVALHIKEDNQATITIVKAGYSSQLRYLNKTQRVSLSVVSEICRTPGIHISYVITNEQKADILTKALSKDKLVAARLLLGFTM